LDFGLDPPTNTNQQEKGEESKHGPAASHEDYTRTVPWPVSTVFPPGDAGKVRHVPATRALLLALAIGGATLALGCRASERVANSQYVGSAACRDCHQAAYVSWDASNHHLAMLPAATSAPLRARPHDDGPMVVRDGAMFMVGPRLDHDGDVALAYALGHRNVEQYVGPLRPGRLQALPLTYDVR